MEGKKGGKKGGSKRGEESEGKEGEGGEQKGQEKKGRKVASALGRFLNATKEISLVLISCFRAHGPEALSHYHYAHKKNSHGNPDTTSTKALPNVGVQGQKCLQYGPFVEISHGAELNVVVVLLP